MIRVTASRGLGSAVSFLRVPGPGFMVYGSEFRGQVLHRRFYTVQGLGANEFRGRV